MIRTLNPRLRAVGRIYLLHSPRHTIPLLRTRSLFNLFKKAPPKPESKPILSQDNLFHPFSKSPFPAIVARGEAIKSLAPCPVCASHHGHIHAHTKAQPRAVTFECPDCGWPTHCTEEHWRDDNDHAKYCSRLREVNEDEHDLRSGRRLREFELPGAFALRVGTLRHTFVLQVQVHRTRKLLYRSLTGMCFGIHVTTRRWTRNDHGDMPANYLHIP
jgi:predicted RNA-binding Zn-ribbon protein involved in translation (DUF1610 family)